MGPPVHLLLPDRENLFTESLGGNTWSAGFAAPRPAPRGG
jgi:hypothetical protein